MLNSRFRSFNPSRLRFHPPTLRRQLASQTLRAYMDSFKPLDFYSGPLVWIDCEMTGLNPRTDKILEIAVGLSIY